MVKTVLSTEFPESYPICASPQNEITFKSIISICTLYVWVWVLTSIKGSWYWIVSMILCSNIWARGVSSLYTTQMHSAFIAPRVWAKLFWGNMAKIEKVEEMFFCSDTGIIYHLRDPGLMRFLSKNVNQNKVFPYISALILYAMCSVYLLCYPILLNCGIIIKQDFSLYQSCFINNVWAANSA